jgi:hypothetical protein
MDRLIQEQSLASENLQLRYRDQLLILDKQLQGAKDKKVSLERAEAQQRRIASRESKSLDIVSKQGLDVVWSWPDVKINQLLCDLLGRARVVIKDGKATGLFFKA